VIFIIFSMVIIGAFLYFPQHISIITNRAWFYYHGEDPTTKLAPSGATITEAMEKVVTQTARAAARMLEREGSRFAEGRDATREL
jgi:hypothetical protein